MAYFGLLLKILKFLPHTRAVLFETSFQAGPPDKLGAITSGYFKNVTAYSPFCGFMWANYGGKGTTRCVFEACTVQANVGPPSATRYGFYDVYSTNLAFRDCVVWDMNIFTNPTQRTMVTNAGASSIRIEGGSIARKFHVSSRRYGAPLYKQHEVKNTMDRAR